MRITTLRNPCSAWRARSATSVLLALSVAALAGCNRFKPNGAADTITLLRSGSARVCVAPDVQQNLRGLILPRPSELVDRVSADGAASAIGTAALTFDATTLQSFDKSVGKATCTTNVQVDGPSHKLKRFRFSYDVSPSAEDVSRVVVTADVSEVRAYAGLQIGDAIARQKVARAQAQEADAAATARQQLLATLTPRWLAGTWIEDGVDAAGCHDGHALTLRANHVAESSTFAGSWALTQDNLHVLGRGTPGRADFNGTVTDADAISFVLTFPDSTTMSFRRCTREEVNAIDPETMNISDELEG